MKTAGDSEPICFFDIEKTALICYHLLNIRRGGGKVKKKSNNAVIQYLKFIVVGSINATVNYVAYAAVVFVGGHYVLATLVGFVLSVLSSYLINSSLVFERDEGVKGWQVLLRLYVVYAFSGLFLTTLLTWLFLDVLNLEEGVRSLGEVIRQSGVDMTDRKLAEYIAPCIVAVIVTPFNFVTNKFFAYKKLGKSSKEKAKKEEVQNASTGRDQ